MCIVQKKGLNFLKTLFKYLLLKFRYFALTSITPQSKTFIGRRKRVRRDEYLRRSNANLNSVNIQNDETILRDTYI